MTTYIAGYDGSDAGRRAVDFARRLAGTAGASVVATTIYPQPRHVYGVGAGEAAERALASEAYSEALDVLADVKAEGIEVAAVPADSPAHGLHRYAEERGANLIVVGTTHHGAAGRLVPGSVGEHLVHGSPCPVAVVPATYDGGAIETIGVAYDGRDESRLAVRAGEALARQHGARVVLYAIYEPVLASYVAPGVPVSTWDYDAEMRKELEKDVQALADGMPESMRMPIRVMGGPPARTLVEAAANDKVDLLVTGSRGYGPVRSVIVGSVSRYAVDHAPCPVLVVPRDIEVELTGDVAATANAGA